MTDGAYKYYAVVDHRSSREIPFVLLRRYMMPNGGHGEDEDMSYAKDWGFTDLMLSWERGDTQFQFIEVAEDEAMQIKERMLEKRRAREEGERDEPSESA